MQCVPVNYLKLSLTIAKEEGLAIGAFTVGAAMQASCCPAFQPQGLQALHT